MIEARITGWATSWLTLGLLAACTGSGPPPKPSVAATASPSVWGEARAPRSAPADDGSTASASASGAAGEGSNEAKRLAAEHPAPPSCEGSCERCRLLYDETAAQPSQGRALSAEELALVRSAYAEYLASPECSGKGLAPDRIGSEEDIGQVFDVLDGTFTERGRRETLVLFFGGACGRAGDATRTRGTRIFALLREGALAASFLNNEGLAAFDRLLDVDGDAVHEVLVVGGWAGKGGLAGWISLRSFAGGRDRSLGFFNTLESGCGWNAEQYWASSIRYGLTSNDRSLCFLEQKATLRCPPILVSDR